MMAAFRNALPPVTMGLAFLALWQGVHALAGSDTIAAPGETLAFLARVMGTSRFWLDVGATGAAFFWAVLLSTVLGVLLGVALGLSRPAGEVAEPVLVTFYALPKVTLYPLVLLVFGLGLSAKVAFGVMHGLVPITLATRSAIGRLRPVYGRTAQALRLGRLDAVRWIMLPAIMPDIVVGVRIGFSLSLLGVLIGEMFASKRGLGFAAMNAMGLGDIKAILSTGVFLAAFAIAANSGLLWLERAVRHRSGLQ